MKILLVGESVFYSLLFYFLSSNYEFHTLLTHKQEDYYIILNSLIILMQNNGLKYVAMLILGMLCICIGLSVLGIKRLMYRNIEGAIKTAITVKCLSCVFMFPSALVATLNNSRYGIITLLTLISVYVLAGLITYIVSLMYYISRL